MKKLHFKTKGPIRNVDIMHAVAPQNSWSVRLPIQYQKLRTIYI